MKNLIALSFYSLRCERIACRNPTILGVSQGKLYDNAESGGRISSFLGGVLQWL